MLSPLFLSLKSAFISTIITFFLGIYIARLVYKINKFKGILDSIFTVTMVLPPTVVGFFLLVILSKNSLLGSFLNSIGIEIIFNFPALIVASVLVSFLLMYRTSLGAFEQIDRTYILAARTLGFSEAKIFWRIIIPLSIHGLLSGVVLSFARSLGEFGATIMIAGNIPGKTQTISTAIYTLTQSGRREEAYKWALVVTFISLLTMILANYLIREKKYEFVY